MTVVDRPQHDAWAPSDAEVARFEAEGYVVCRGLFADDIADIQAAFDASVREAELLVVHCESYDASATGCDDHPRLMAYLEGGHEGALAWLPVDPRVAAVNAALLGPDHTYLASQLNLFSCDVAWHDDGIFGGGHGRHLLHLLYLDPLDGSSGALRVVPGSHEAGGRAPEARRRLAAPGAVARPDAVPAEVLAVEPGDLVVIDFGTLHASFGGRMGRRMLSMSFGPTVASPGSNDDIAGCFRRAHPWERAKVLAG